MKAVLLKNKGELIILVAALILGAWARTANLSGARFLFGDEFRTFSAGSSKFNSPLLYAIYWIPLHIWGYKEVVAIRFTALLGMLNLVMVYLIGKSFFNLRTGIYSAVLLSPLGIHVWFSRTGQPVIAETFMTLTAFLFLGLFLEKKSGPLYPFLAGLFLGLAFLIYVPVYPIIAAVMILFPVSLNRQGVPLKKTAGALAVLSIGMLLPLVAFEIICRLKTGSYIFYLYLYYKDTTKFSPHQTSEFLTFFRGISFLGGTWQLVLLMGGYAWGMISCFREKNSSLILLAGTAGIGFLLFTVMAFLGKHSISLRKYIHLIPFMVLVAAYCLDKFNLPSAAVNVFLIVFLIISLQNCLTIVNKTFNIYSIKEWLKEKGIKEKELATRLNLNMEGRTAGKRSLPGKLFYYEDRSRIYFIIDWNQLKKMYLKGEVRYLLSSGMNYCSTVGYRDSVLKTKTPLKTWKHPYLFLKMPNPRKNMINNTILYDRVQNFSLYDLQEVF
ncbi:MAG: ArnT family glycosyltransferase [bacterium]